MKSFIEQSLSRVESLKIEGRQPVVVFDLDATLFDNAPRNRQILLEYAEKNKDDDLLRILLRAQHTRWPYSITEVLTWLGYHGAEHIDSIQKFWFERFFTNTYQQYDIASPRAVRMVKQYYDAGCTVVYMSGRDAPGMLHGCVQSLFQNGFPIGLPRTQLTLKPAFEMSDADFKSESITFIDTLGEVILSIDNETHNCNIFKSAWGDADIVWMDTHTSPNSPPLNDGILSVSCFTEWL